MKTLLPTKSNYSDCCRSIRHFLYGEKGYSILWMSIWITSWATWKR